MLEIIDKELFNNSTYHSKTPISIKYECGHLVSISKGSILRAIKRNITKCRSCVASNSGKLNLGRINYLNGLNSAIESLKKENNIVTGTETRYILWTCINNHNLKSHYRDINHGSRCQKCKRIGRTPRKINYIPVGTRNADLEVTEYLGVNDGFSKVKVKDIVKGNEFVLTTGKFKKPRKTNDELKQILSNNGKLHKGIKADWNAKHTFGDLRQKCKELNFEFLHNNLDNEKVYKVIENIWNIKCFCGNIFNPRINGILNGNTRSCGCVISRPELEIRAYVTSLCPDTLSTATRRIIPPLELDVYVPSKNVAFEHCGLHYHGELWNESAARTKHIDKLKLCRQNNVRLITIFEDEWREKQSQVKGYLKAILNKQEFKIGARECEIREIESDLAYEFLNNNHIQGKAYGKHIGLFFDNQLLALATFAKPNASRNIKKNNYIELSRYCVAINYQIYGGLSKILSYFNKLYKYDGIITYSDNRWSNGNLYLSTGFKKITEGKPSYWYFKARSSGPKYHRYKYRKSEAIRIYGKQNENDTEWDIVSRNGLDRIWDCGSTTWLLDLKS